MGKDLLDFKLCIPSYLEEPKPVHGRIFYLYSRPPTCTT